MAEHHAYAGGRTTAMTEADLVYVEACRSLTEARRREKQLKTRLLSWYWSGHHRNELGPSLYASSCRSASRPGRGHVPGQSPP